MPMTSWHDFYSVDVRSIDAQHREMIDILNSAHQAAIDGEGPQEVACIISQLSQTMDRHFRDEEVLMRLGEWPASSEHLRQHHKMSLLVRDIELDLRLSRIEPATALIQALKDKLVGHTIHEASAYRERLAAGELPR